MPSNLGTDRLKKLQVTWQAIAVSHALEDLLNPVATFATRCALTTRLVSVEVCKVEDGVDHVDRIIHDYNTT